MPMTSFPVPRIMNQPLLAMFLCMAAIAALLIPLHHRMETLITNMLVSKLSPSEVLAPAGNNRVRLEAAKRTIGELGSKQEN